MGLTKMEALNTRKGINRSNRKISASLAQRSVELSEDLASSGHQKKSMNFKEKPDKLTTNNRISVVSGGCLHEAKGSKDSFQFCKFNLILKV